MIKKLNKSFTKKSKIMVSIATLVFIFYNYYYYNMQVQEVAQRVPKNCNSYPDVKINVQ